MDLTVAERRAVDSAVDELVGDLTPDEATRFRELVHHGLEARDTTAPASWFIEHEIAPAASLPTDERIRWAVGFDADPHIRALNSDAAKLVRALLDGGPSPELRERAVSLVDHLNGIEIEELPKHLVRMRNEAIADGNWIIADGAGPASLRTGRAMEARGR